MDANLWKINKDIEQGSINTNILKFDRKISCRVSSSLVYIFAFRILIPVYNKGWKDRYLFVWLETTVH